MEEITNLYGQERLDKFRELQTKSIEYQRFVKYSNKIDPFTVIDKKETDTHVYISQSQATPIFNNKLVLTFKRLTGCTYDKQKKTLKFWFGKTPIKSYEVYNQVLIHFKLDWLSEFDKNANVSSIMTTSLLQRCIRGKITNPRQLCKAIISSKRNLRDSGISPEALFRYFNYVSYYKINIQAFIYNITSIKQPDLYVDYLISSKAFTHFHDLLNQAKALNKKVDMTWSDKRRATEHALWTREMMALEIMSVEPLDYEYPDIDLPEGLSLIKTNHELFEEGTTMRHCIYTNYAGRIKFKDYFGMRYQKDGIRATIGISYDSANKRVYMDQMYGIGNSGIDYEHKEYVKAWLDKPEIQAYFKAIQMLKIERPHVMMNMREQALDF